MSTLSQNIIGDPIKTYVLTFSSIQMLSTRLPGQVFPFHHVRLNQSDQLSMELHSE